MSQQRAKSVEELHTVQQCITRVEALEFIPPTADRLYVHMMTVGDEPAIAMVAWFESCLKEVDVKMGRVMAKGDE